MFMAWKARPGDVWTVCFANHLPGEMRAGSSYGVFCGFMGELLMRIYHESQAKLVYGVRDIVELHG